MLIDVIVAVAAVVVVVLVAAVAYCGCCLLLSLSLMLLLLLLLLVLLLYKSVNKVRPIQKLTIKAHCHDTVVAVAFIMIYISRPVSMSF